MKETTKTNNCAITSKEAAFFPMHLDAQFENSCFSCQ